jgi:hypothetical protein
MPFGAPGEQRSQKEEKKEKKTDLKTGHHKRIAARLPERVGVNSKRSLRARSGKAWAIHGRCADHPEAFEKCGLEIFQLRQAER